ncbi:thioredoxin [Acinetobacter phage vB_AbaM_PhT2]|uniref:Thioredoxin n=1 Tax=Acinetobacter phage vB_AbaM_PhT2 TaxID=2690230 RepID=A0A6B9SW27_9CAUD|nr:thioredoxin [Acinetobacter phage vB_AbaM_PhT2]QHJ75824.1 thioredoxin [Acinetobacter phage vB_AbaM_PhT2]
MYTIYGYLPEVQKCINCDSAKRLCTAKGKEYEFVSIASGTDENGPIWTKEFHGMLAKLGKTSPVGISLPVIFKGDVYIGGFAELRKDIALSK